MGRHLFKFQSRRAIRLLWPAWVLAEALAILGIAQADNKTSPNIFSGGDMTEYTTQVNPWAGLDINGDLHVLSAVQLAVDDSGSIRNLPFSPCVAVGDLNGDGLLDLVVADPKGFFWYYPNSGTKTQPKFTTGEVMPIWLGSSPLSQDDNDQLSDAQKEGRQSDHYVPRIDLADLSGTGKLDLIVGTCAGALYIMHNIGSATRPHWQMPPDPDDIRTIPTRKDRRLDCNYFSPCLYDFFRSGQLDLLRGDGTYSANSIFLYPNHGTRDQPEFDDSDRIRIIPGLGREHLVPRVVDWNNDGKPDVITGEREGFVDLFLNTSQDPKNPSFDTGQHIKIGGQEKFGGFTEVTVTPLTGNPQVPDLILTDDSGQISLCHNTGKPGSPQFNSPPQPIKGGPNPFSNILVPDRWALGAWNGFAGYTLHGWSEGPPYGVPYELLVITNAHEEAGFKPPEGVAWKNALKYEVLNPKSVYFPEHYYPKREDERQQHSILNTQGMNLKSETQYEITFWIKGDGVHDASYHLHGTQRAHPGTDDDTRNWISMDNNVSLSSSWSQVTDTVSWSTTNGVKKDPNGFGLSFTFLGQGDLYLADMQVHELP